MAIPREFVRVLPCLCDKLVDDDPTASADPGGVFSMSPQSYRDAVARDLEWLLNTPTTLPDSWVERFPQLADSVLNFGVHDHLGDRSGGLEGKLAYEIREAILRFEPRILPDSLQITGVGERESARPNRRTFRIEAEIWARPLPQDLFLHTELDLETGKFSVERSG
jgi:type VI secretion system protein ImpF